MLKKLLLGSMLFCSSLLGATEVYKCQWNEGLSFQLAIFDGATEENTPAGISVHFSGVLAKYESQAPLLELASLEKFKDVDFMINMIKEQITELNKESDATNERTRISLDYYQSLLKIFSTETYLVSTQNSSKTFFLDTTSLSLISYNRKELLKGNCNKV